MAPFDEFREWLEKRGTHTAPRSIKTIVPRCRRVERLGFSLECAVASPGGFPTIIEELEQGPVTYWNPAPIRCG
jgi:hypothetical protein